MSKFSVNGGLSLIPLVGKTLKPDQRGTEIGFAG